MAAAPTAEQRASRRHRSPAEKRRIVELTLRAGSSLRAIASEHGVHPNSLRRWKALYRAGELKAPAQREPRVVAAAASATGQCRLAPPVRKSCGCKLYDVAVRKFLNFGKRGIPKVLTAKGQARNT
jgi:transposase-like protein